jgi:hypothetical protein
MPARATPRFAPPRGSTTTTSTTTTTTSPPPATTQLGPAATGPSAPPCSPVAVAGGVYAVGDSVMLDAQEPLQTCVPAMQVNAAVSRQWSDGETLLSQVMAGPSPPSVVVGCIGDKRTHHRRRLQRHDDDVEGQHVLVHLLDPARAGYDGRYVLVARTPRDGELRQSAPELVRDLFQVLTRLFRSAFVTIPANHSYPGSAALLPSGTPSAYLPVKRPDARGLQVVRPRPMSS